MEQKGWLPSKSLRKSSSQSATGACHADGFLLAMDGSSDSRSYYPDANSVHDDVDVSSEEVSSPPSSSQAHSVNVSLELIARPSLCKDMLLV